MGDDDIVMSGVGQKGYKSRLVETSTLGNDIFLVLEIANRDGCGICLSKGRIKAFGDGDSYRFMKSDQSLRSGYNVFVVLDDSFPVNHYDPLFDSVLVKAEGNKSTIVYFELKLGSHSKAVSSFVLQLVFFFFERMSVRDCPVEALILLDQQPGGYAEVALREVDKEVQMYRRF